ncbi:transcriptional regulator ATRX homolog [Diabrotica virgifera virgifera]|uniref:Transcriptional regulator ATRX homolog n=1 Tax=Diabrotica virgifera virgifera TaxID=50390 RepID=A0A6P7G121_DIAVI|nr:transcriptional regulator ATRX homolog [Diabrotica virgifera virgifera]
MVKRKTVSDSEDEQKPSKKSKASTSEALNPNTPFKPLIIKKEIQEDETTIQPKATPKVKKKKKEHVSSSDSDQEKEKQSTIESILNETKRLVLSTKKPKKPKKSQKQNDASKLNESFTNKNLKTEALDSFENSIVQDEESGDNLSNEVEPVNNVLNGEKSPRISISDKNEDDNLMEKIENKVQILQNIHVSPNKTKSSQESLKDLYPNIKTSPIKTKLKLKSSCDVYMLRIPKSVDANGLLNVSIDLEGKSKVTIGGQKFVIQHTSKIPDPTFVLSTKPHLIEFKRNLVMEKYVKPNKGPNIPTIEKSSVPLPGTLKNRHPLFGSNFEDKIQLDEAVEKKLLDAIEKLLNPKKSKKDKKAKEDRRSLTNSTMLPNVTSSQDSFSPNVSSISPKKKIKKEKRQVETNNSEIFNDISMNDVFNPDDFIPPARKTKIKKEKLDPVLDNMSNDQEENAESPKKAKKRKIKEEPVDFSPPKKKKKKSVKEEYG